MKHYAFIPARGGSKGLPRKNFLEICGRQTLDYTILSAKAAGIFDGIWVVSDVVDGSERSRALGVEFLDEPTDLAGDHVSSTAPVLWAAKRLGLGDDDVIWNLQPTSPLRVPGDLKRAAQRLKSSPEANFVTSVTPIDPHYFHWALRGKGEELELRFPDYLVERHLLPPMFRPNGAIKAGFLSKLRTHGSVFAEGLVGIEMPEARAIHIREQWDLEIARHYVECHRTEFKWANL